VDAVLVLNALLGAFDRSGGIVASPARPIDDLDNAARLLRDVASGKRRPAALVFRDASPLRDLATPIIPTASADTVPFIVSFSPYLDEAAALADLLLPTHTSLESWHLVTPASAVQAELIAAAPPAVAARLNTRDLIDALKRTANAIGGSAAVATPWHSSGDIVREALSQVAARHRGGPYSGAYETEWLRQLEQGGWWVPTAEGGDAAIAALLQAGGWGDPAFQPGAIRETLRARRGLTFPAPVALPVRPTVAATTAAMDARTDQPSLHLVAFTPSVVNLAGNPNQPALFELLGQPDGMPWSVWAELHPDAARERGIRDGDRVRLASTMGSLEARAQLVDGMPRGSVAVSFVPGVAATGRWAELLNEDVRRLYGPNGFAGARTVTVVRV
jgi:anaerobic selenocysteine-containing dehydrogenase